MANVHYSIGWMLALAAAASTLGISATPTALLTHPLFAYPASLDILLSDYVEAPYQSDRLDVIRAYEQPFFDSGDRHSVAETEGEDNNNDFGESEIAPAKRANRDSFIRLGKADPKLDHHLHSFIRLGRNQQPRINLLTSEQDGSVGGVGVSGLASPALSELPKRHNTNSFIRLGRGPLPDGDVANTGDLGKRSNPNSFIRLGRQPSFIRLGRRSKNSFRSLSKRTNFARLTRDDASNAAEGRQFGRRGDNFIRFGKRSEADQSEGGNEKMDAPAVGSNADFYRILGLSDGMKRLNSKNFVRFGRSGADSLAAHDKNQSTEASMTDDDAAPDGGSDFQRTHFQ